MANIMLNYACNLSCSYCFASDFVQHRDSPENTCSPNNISVENFKRAVNFLAKDKEINPNNHVRIGVIGGEPTLHPRFKELMEILLYDDRVDSVNLFTNGLDLDGLFNVLSHAKVTLMVNLNSPDDIGVALYDKIIENLDQMVRDMHMGVGGKLGLGINLYRPDFDYSYMVNALVKYNLRRVRTSIAVPNVEKKGNFDLLEYFRSMKPLVFAFFKELEKHRIMPTYDCNYLPTCLVTRKEMEWLKSFWSMENLAKCYCNIADDSRCSPVIDILPDLNAIRCFGMSDQGRVPIHKFNHLGELVNYFTNRYDIYACNVFNAEACRHCDKSSKMLCTGGCLSFKADKINRAARLVSRIA